MVITEAFAQYAEEEIIGMGGSLNTCEGYKYALKAFVAEWGNIEVETITAAMTKRFAVEFQSKVGPNNKTHSIGTVRNYLACLRTVVGMCKIKGLSVIEPATIRLPKREKKIPLCLEQYEVEALVEVANRPIRGYPTANRLRNVLIIKMLYATGLRISELCRLDITDIRNRELVVIGKSKEPRTCYITAEIEALIAQYVKRRSDRNPALFVSSQTGGQRISAKTVQSMFRRIRRELAVGKATPHTMRHSYCTKLLDCGVDIRYTAELMGHQSWDTTRIYTHIKNRQLKEVYDAAIK